MKIYKTTDYFHISEKEAAKRVDDYNTKEEAMVLDEGEEYYFFETLKCLTEEYNSDERKNYVETYHFETILFQFVADNMNHNRYCMVFR